MGVARVKMSFVTLKMSGNPTSPMFLFLPFPGRGEGAGAAGSLALGVDVRHPRPQELSAVTAVSVEGSPCVRDEITAVRALDCLCSVGI